MDFPAIGNRFPGKHPGNPADRLMDSLEMRKTCFGENLKAEYRITMRPRALGVSSTLAPWSMAVDRAHWRNEKR